jgi:hypothetical protein
MSVDDLLKSRHDYFPQGIYIAGTFIKDFLGLRRQIYYDAVEFRENRRLGFYFFIVTCILDVAVCSI